MGKTDIKIKTISLKSFKCFDNIQIDCTKDDKSSVFQWTVLLGNNNTGKTSLLKAIADLRPAQLKRVERNTKTAITPESEKQLEFVPAFFYDIESQREVSEAATVQCTTSMKNLHQWNYTKSVMSVKEDSNILHFQIYGYGVSRYPSKTSLSESNIDCCTSLFHQDKKLINIEEWLMQLDYAAKNNKEMAEQRLQRIKELLCGNLFPEIIDFKFESSDSLHNYALFETKDGWFRYTQLGYGYQSMLSWIVDLCKRMFERYPDSNNPLEESAIVLVDEIDLHLHPKWQRDIISFLSKAFPNIQFIVTTHSPLVIQSMDNVNLYVLHREENKVIAERSDISNFRGWTIEEILRDTMRLESDIHSNDYQNYINIFDKGLDQNNKEVVREAYKKLCKMLHPTNPIRRLLEMQFSQIDNE